MSGSAHAGTTLFFITTHVWSPNQGQKKRGCTLTPWWLPCTMHMHGASPLPLYFPPGAPPECSPQAKTHAVSAHRRCCRGPAPPLAGGDFYVPGSVFFGYFFALTNNYVVQGFPV